jgi:putative hydrolase of the HAD superfamily
MNADTAIFFDLDGTLVQFTRPYGEVLAATFETHLGAAGDDLGGSDGPGPSDDLGGSDGPGPSDDLGGSDGPGPSDDLGESDGPDDPGAADDDLGRTADELVATYDEAFYDALHDFAPDPYRRGMAAVVEAAGADADPEAMVATLRAEEYAATAVDPALSDSLASLGEDAALGVLTNGVADWQAGKLERHGLAAHFDAVVTSYDASAHKPDPAVFELAAERLPAAEYAMVGDDDVDVEGARNAGWVPVRYEDRDEGPAFWETVGALL